MSIAVLVLIASSLGASPARAAMPTIEDNVAIPMRDGVTLAAALYIPADGAGSWPVIVSTTPYDRWPLHRIGMLFASKGYVFAAVDVRGRGDSEGVFDPFRKDAEDGYDTIEWLARQSFSSGDVGMWGASYGGFNQWAAAKEFPPSLKSILPSAAVYPGVDFPMWKNVAYPYVASWTAYTSGKAARRALFNDLKYWEGVYYRALKEGRPYTDLDEIAGYVSPLFDLWTENATQNDYWAAVTPTQEQFEDIDLPILTVTGWYDGAQMGALEYYNRHMAVAGRKARRNHYLVLGPFDHAGTQSPQKQVGGLTIDEAGVLDIRALEIAWFDWTLKDGPKPEFLQDRIAYYVAGAAEWRHAASLENMTADMRVYYPAALENDAGSVDRAGALQTDAPSEPAEASYVYDPTDLSAALLGTWVAGPWMTHDKDVLALDGGGLVYETQAYETLMEFVGAPKLEAWISIDTPDTDIRARLYEVTADGKSIFLSTDRIRARFRNSFAEEELLEPGAVEKYVFDAFILNGRRLAAGSRLRLVLDAPNSVHEQRNYNSGGIVAEETMADARTVTVRLHQNDAHRTSLFVPLAEARQ